jgi:hypothetical protein
VIQLIFAGKSAISSVKSPVQPAKLPWKGVPEECEDVGPQALQRIWI